VIFDVRSPERILSALLCYFCLCPATYAGAALNRIIAIVNDDVVMQSELQAEVRTISARIQEQGTALPPPEILEKQVLDNLIMTKLQIQTALETGIRVDDETLNRMISNIAAESKLSLKELRDILEADNYSYEKYRNDLRNEILISRLRQRQVDNRIMVTSSEIDTFLENQEQQGKGDLEYRLSHILIATPANASINQLQQIRLKADSLLEQLKNGDDFSQAASTHSDGQQALNGGDLGWRKSGEIPTLFSDIVANMEQGDISNLINSPSGYHIIKLADIRSTEMHVVTQTHARHILLTPDEINTEDDIKRRMEQIYIRIEGGDNFAELARGNSLDPGSAAEGGDLGWINPGDLAPEFEQVMNQLDIGETSRPFQSQFGWHIVQVLDRREHDNTVSLRRSRAREAIRQRKLEEAHEAWLRQMRDDAYVEYRLNN
jgi:peptidyl-prolyl cis-trans isomerase SurA